MDHLAEYIEEQVHYLELCALFDEEPKLDGKGKPDPSHSHYDLLKKKSQKDPVLNYSI